MWQSTDSVSRTTGWLQERQTAVWMLWRVRGKIWWDLFGEYSQVFIFLSYDVAIIQWITSCHEIWYGHTLHNTWLLALNVITPSATTLWFIWNFWNSPKARFINFIWAHLAHYVYTTSHERRCNAINVKEALYKRHDIASTLMRRYINDMCLMRNEYSRKIFYIKLS